MLSLKLYGYGSLYWGGVQHEKPAVYSLLDTNQYTTQSMKANDIGPSYRVSDTDSKNVQKKTGVYIHLSVKQSLHDVLANIEIDNNSSESYFLHKQNLPARYSIAQKKIKNCSNMFLITAENIRLDYLGGSCEYYSINDRNAWVELPAKKNIRFTVKLNDDYVFLKGVNFYNIGTLEYTMVNTAWFTRQRINELLFLILNFKSECFDDENKITSYDRDKCDSNNENDIEYHLFRFGIDGGNTDSFQFRSNQVSIELDEGKISSLLEGR
ncbi:hypothetical protein SNQ11_000962 [Cronobacter sakazakii]|nr:hypothetical protein [Cronobacter sakazakii]